MGLLFSCFLQLFLSLSQGRWEWDIGQAHKKSIPRFYPTRVLAFGGVRIRHSDWLLTWVVTPL